MLSVPWGTGGARSEGSSGAEARRSSSILIELKAERVRTCRSRRIETETSLRSLSSGLTEVEAASEDLVALLEDVGESGRRDMRKTSGFEEESG